MTKRLAIPGLALAAALSAATCFDPDYQAGIECSSDGECPSGFECASDSRCYPEGEGPPDASVQGDSGGMADASMPPDGGMTDECDVLEQDCPSGMKCTYVVEEPGQPPNGRIACVPDGDTGVGNACGFNQSFEEGNHDDCLNGLVCNSIENGVCVPFCDATQFECDSPVANPVCARFEGLLEGNPSQLGVCVPEVPKKVVSGPLHTCALSNAGRVQCWGDNSDGQIGHVTVLHIGLNEAPSDVPPVEIGGRAVDLDTGGIPCTGDGCPPSTGHTCVALESGDVRCWGANNEGQLGIGSTEPVGFERPPLDVSAVDVGGKAVAVSLGWAHSCARLDSGAVKCWGFNLAGQLGQAISERAYGDDQDEPVSNLNPIDVGGPVVEVAAGDQRTCAILDGEGLVSCWGGPGDSLGYPEIPEQDNVGDDEVPASVGQLELSALATIDAGLQYTCGAEPNGRSYCWGYDFGANNCPNLGIPSNDGIIGDNEAIESHSLESAIRQFELAGELIADANGNISECPKTWALDQEGLVRTWGSDAQAAQAFSFGNQALTMIQIAIGRDHQCGLSKDAQEGNFAEVACYGSNAFGQLGQGDPDLGSLPQDGAAPVSVF